MTPKSFRLFAFLLLSTLFFSAPRIVYATAIAFSDIAFFNLQITPSVGSIQFLDLWTAEAFAQASNSLGQRDQAFDFSVGGVAVANAAVTFANGHADASALNLTAIATSAVNIPGAQEAQASSVGLGTLFNSFIITGGTGPVEVGFSADIAGLLNVFTDETGLRARTRTIFALELDGTPILFHDLFLDVGPNSASTLAFSQILFATLSLQFNTPFFILAQVDSESLGINTPIPEPSTITLMLVGLGALAGFARKTVKRNNWSLDS